MIMNNKPGQPIKGQCVEAGDDDAGQPRLIIHTTRDELAGSERNVVFEDVVMVLGDELDAATVVAFDGRERTVTLQLDLMPLVTIGDQWLVRINRETP